MKRMQVRFYPKKIKGNEVVIVPLEDEIAIPLPEEYTRDMILVADINIKTIKIEQK